MNLDVIELQVKDFKKAFEWYKKLFKPLFKGKNNQKTLYFASRSLGKEHSTLKRKGVKVSSIAKVHWGRKFSFNDLEGNKHFVYEER